MAIDKKTRAEILRLYHIEKWKIGTIVRQLGVHRYTVERVLADTGEPRHAISPRPSMIDPYVPFIIQTLASWPALPASRPYQMVRERGYPGGSDHFRHLIAPFRPKLRRRPICVSRPFPASRPRSIGDTWARSGSGVRSAC